MSMLDAIVLVVLTSGAGWPLFSRWLASATASLKPRPATSAATAEGSPIQEWRQAWASTLIRMIDEIEAGHGHFDDPKAALRLSKELLWEVIGGDGPQPSKSK